ncbi:TlpA family protein disulfide reductase [Polaromonas sp. UC242_47]|uniref:TlpA family protein disulfide reductase n=1 Tax=Polaromonas sp. UC242_47 TaxID=3374626 RepID=UPI0037874A21
MKRRQLMYVGAAAVAGLAGAGVAWRKFEPHGDPALAQDVFWQQSFDTPTGEALPMASFAGKPLLVNFWATWCPPCVEELPLIDRFHQDNQSKNWQVLGLAVDQPSAVRAWLQRKPLSFPVAMAGLGGTELSKAMGNAAGGLPFTVVFGGSGQVLHRKIGQVSASDLAQWAQLV